MTKRQLARGIKKFLRHQKAKIRREVSDLAEQEAKIKELYQRFGFKN